MICQSVIVPTNLGTLMALPTGPVHAGGVGPVHGEDVDVEINVFIFSLSSLTS